MPKVTNLSNRGDVVIPKIVDLSYDTAKQLLYNDGLRISVREKAYDEHKEVNTILTQDPLAGKKVKRGRHLFVTVSKGKEAAQIPEVMKLSEGPAKSALRSVGFDNIKVDYVYSGNVPRNSAVFTRPKAGTSTSREVDVRLYLSKGARPTHATVPNIVGEMLSTAKRQVRKDGLVVGTITYDRSSVMGAGRIVSQSLTPGSSVKLESRVNLVVSAK